VHTVLHLQADGAVAQQHKPLEEAAVEAGFGCLPANHHGSEL
jgi:hypothetical protein